MKTRQEVEQIKIRVEKSIELFRDSAKEASQKGDQRVFEQYEIELGKRVAQYNILLEILR